MRYRCDIWVLTFIQILHYCISSHTKKCQCFHLKKLTFLDIIIILRIILKEKNPLDTFYIQYSFLNIIQFARRNPVIVMLLQEK